MAYFILVLLLCSIVSIFLETDVFDELNKHAHNTNIYTSIRGVLMTAKFG